jgi:Phage tail tube, TTP, lambda-like
MRPFFSGGISMALLTQGTELFFVDPEDFSIVEVGCVTTLTGITTPREQIEVTCLDSTGREYVPGLAAPGTATFTINFDPQDPSHVRLHELFEDATITTVEWAVGFSDGTAAPTSADSSGIVTPTTRTWLLFAGYLNDFPFDVALNSVVTNNIGIQISGRPVLLVKTT